VCRIISYNTYLKHEIDQMNWKYLFRTHKIVYTFLMHLSVHTIDSTVWITLWRKPYLLSRSIRTSDLENFILKLTFLCPQRRLWHPLSLMCKVRNRLSSDLTPVGLGLKFEPCHQQQHISNNWRIQKEFTKREHTHRVSVQSSELTKRLPESSPHPAPHLQFPSECPAGSTGFSRRDQ
jgi:hypothetical protein